MLFGLLGLPAQFDLDPPVIESAFFDRSKELHPDRFASAPASERVAALSRSRALNDAYQTLKKPVRAGRVPARARRRRPSATTSGSIRRS